MGCFCVEIAKVYLSSRELVLDQRVDNSHSENTKLRRVQPRDKAKQTNKHEGLYAFSKFVQWMTVRTIVPIAVHRLALSQFS